MRTVLTASAVFFSFLRCFGQDLLSTAAAQRACGSPTVEYKKPVLDAAHSGTSVVPQGKALVYLFQMYDPHGEPCLGGCGALVRFGLDGRWKGVTFGDSFLVETVDAGDHHLCANWQGTAKRSQRIVALKALHAEPGHSYFYGVRVTDVGSGGGTFGFDFVSLDEDEARMLLESYPQSRSESKP